MKKLLQEKQLTYTGTMRKNKNENGQEKSSVFGFHDDFTMVSNFPKNRSVILLSFMHFDYAIDEKTGDINKPVILTDCNHTNWS